MTNGEAGTEGCVWFASPVLPLLLCLFTLFQGLRRCGTPAALVVVVVYCVVDPNPPVLENANRI